jgi:transcriptional regulator with GAF, ATPase, and Fis domain/predicted ATPase
MDPIGFDIREELGKGPTLRLCRAQGRNGQAVLIKTASRGADGNMAAVRLRREFDICRHVQIQGIIRPIDLVEYANQTILVFEDRGCQSLEHVLRNAPLELEISLKIARNLASILAGLHRSGYIHRDIQPSNILVTRETAAIEIHGLGVATQVPRSVQGIQDTAIFEAPPSYMSPELSGRTNRLVDYRTDFYSLGVILFEMVTGRLPFEVDDPLEMMHNLIAKHSPLASDVIPTIPSTVADIIQKLMAKSAEDRYQGGRGLCHDLDRCLVELETTGSIAPFQLGDDDPPALFELSQRLYGREQELATLLHSFEDSAKGALQVVMVTGYPGVGKTSLVQELRREIFARGGRFVSGKYDALERGTPYNGILEALRDLWRRLLADEPERLDLYRQKIKEALGQNVGVIVNIAPELKAIVGETLEAPDLAPTELKNRFHMCFQQTLKILATADHPLVLFLDDLQWADPSSLELIEATLEKGLGNFMFLGAYREIKGGDRHPLMQTLSRMEDKSISVETVSLGALNQLDIRRLVADTLRIDTEQATPLADLVFQKTAGNAFFSKAFITTLHEEGFLNLENRSNGNWDLQRISGLESTENVVDLATRKIAQIPDRIRTTVAMAAALGHPLDIVNLAAVCETSVENVESDLIEACRERIFIKHEQYYQFEHDRLQEGAYALIPVTSRAETHLRIGRLLARQRHSGRIFEAIDHYNRALNLITEPEERDETARMNLVAGRTAKAAAAFPAAYHYFSNGLSLIYPDSWSTMYDLALALHTEAAEAASLIADFQEADRLICLVLSNAHNVLDKIPAYETQIAIAHASLRETDAFRITFDVLKLLGIEITDHPYPEEVNIAVIAARQAVETAMIGPPKMELADSKSTAAMRLLTRAAIAAGIVNHPLYLTIANQLINIAIRNGQSPEAPVAYIMTGGILCYVLDDYETGYRVGERGMELLTHSDSPRWQAFCHFLFTIDINCWRQHFDVLADSFAKTHRMGLESGDFMTASMSAYFCCESYLYAGKELSQLESLISDYYEESSRTGVRRVASGLLRLKQMAISLMQGEKSSYNLHSISDLADKVNDDAWQAWHVSADQSVREVTTCHDMMLLCLFRQSTQALQVALKAHELPPGGVTGFLPSEFYICLILMEACRKASDAEKEQYLPILALRQERARIKARICPINYQHKWDLIQAMQLRLNREYIQAMEYFDRAIEGARLNRYVHEEALANELAAEFYLDFGRERIAAIYFQQAAGAYGRWGAWGKVDQLHERYGRYLSQGSKSGLPTVVPNKKTMETSSEELDIASIERAAAALTQELDLPILLENLMNVLLQNAGAQRGFLLRDEGGHIIVEASGSAELDGVQVLQKIPIEQCEHLSRSIIRYVSRSHETIVTGDATQDQRFSGTPYVTREHPKSILCTPVIHRGKPVAILYLENNLIRDAFNGERLTAIQLISSQAAVALENTRLHDGLKQEVLTRRHAEDELRQALKEVARLKDRLHAENVYLREEILGAHGFEEIVGKSDILKRVLNTVAQVAATDATVLILGETGTGKELVARAIHSRSLRKERTLVRINCATLPATLIESELFGHEKGAFTGALARKMGRFELADGGTIFLDEIGELPLELQAKLLRVLQEGEFERVGSAVTQKVSVRVIAATNRDLKREAEEGKFRRDLYYRLSVFPIELPPLRSRSNDIPLLAWYFISKKQAELGKTISKIPKDVMETLVTYQWPGNIRELENVIERAVILSHGPALTLHDSLGGGQTFSSHNTAVTDLDEIERRHILQVLEQCSWKVKGTGNAADKLGLNPSTLSFRMRKLGIARP